MNFKKEIILSDLAGVNGYKNKYILDNSQTNLISNSQMMNQTFESKSLNSLKPILYNQHDSNQTIMIDDFMSSDSQLADKKGYHICIYKMT